MDPRLGLHHLILRQPTMRFRFHRVPASLVQVLDEAQVEGTTTILVALELGDSCLGSLGSVESNNTRASRPAARLILNLSLLNLANGGKKLHKIVVASRPRQLFREKVKLEDVKSGRDIRLLTFRT